MNKSARNERRKLTATLLNTVASGTIIAAIVVPAIGWALGTMAVGTDILNIAGASTFAVLLAFMVHRIALEILKGMEE